MTRAHLTDAGPDIHTAAIYTTLCAIEVGEGGISLTAPTCRVCLLRGGIMDEKGLALCRSLPKERQVNAAIDRRVASWMAQRGGVWSPAPVVAPPPAISPVFDPTPHDVTAQRWESPGPGIVARSVAGDDTPSDGWSSPGAAFDEWARNEIASPVGSSSRYGDTGGGGSGDHTPAAISRSERAIPVARALAAQCLVGRSFPGDADGNGAWAFSSDDMTAIYRAALIGKKSIDDIAGRFARDGAMPTPRQVGIVLGGITKGAIAWLVERRLLRPVAQPRARAYHGSRDARNKGASMALPDGFDLEGRAQIAGALGISTATLGRWMQGDDPPPVAECKGSVIASRAALRAWLSSHVIERKRAGAA